MFTPHPNAIIYLLERLDKGSHIDESSGCIVWDGAVDHAGYGRIKVCGYRRIIHRLVYTLIKSEPQNLVLHRCDNRRCWNIDHLWEGTAKENTRDMIEKGRDNFWGERS